MTKKRGYGIIEPTLFTPPLHLQKIPAAAAAGRRAGAKAFSRVFLSDRGEGAVWPLPRLLQRKRGAFINADGGCGNFFSHGQTKSVSRRQIGLQAAKACGAPFSCHPFCLSRVRRPRLRGFPARGEGRNVPRKPPGAFYGPLGRKSLTRPTPGLKTFFVTHPQKEGRAFALTARRLLQHTSEKRRLTGRGI